ncbi:MAG: hypothetical protein AB2L11_11260 [Syntrophobacteraceae bacterium]
MFFNFFRGIFKGAILLEAGAAIIFLGSLAQQPELTGCAAKALAELKTRGYTVPSASSPVKVYPANAQDSHGSSQAGVRRPGVILLREKARGKLGLQVQLRHELMYEANSRSCSGKLPPWAEEAAAVSFSGELSDSAAPGRPTENELDQLRKRVRSGTPLDDKSYRGLSKLVATHGWPKEPCAESERIARLLNAPGTSERIGFNYILIHLFSGRVFESRGDQKAKYTPGSLLKIPFAAALKDVPAEAIGRGLSEGDSAQLLKWRGGFNPDYYRFFISIVKNTRLGRSISSKELAARDEKFWRQYIGERGKDGSFPYEAGLHDLALMLRASILYQPGYFSGLSRNGFSEGSTLYSEQDKYKRALKSLHAMSKTATVSDEQGHPLVGYLMVAWPAEKPTFLALFRSTGKSGASNLRRAVKILDDWSVRYPPEFGRVRVRVMSLSPRSAWEVVDECPSYEKEGPKNLRERVSTCGGFIIMSSAKGGRSERFVSGVLETSPDGQKVVLETDPETFADSVLSLEANGLDGEAEKAVRAVIAWNGMHGAYRHEDTSSLCDSTHCMAFQGMPYAVLGIGDRTEYSLLRLLDKIAEKKQLKWFPFTKGGTSLWEKLIPPTDLRKILNVPAVLDIRRERTRNEEIIYHITYPQHEEIVPCETFRNRLRLPSCPETIHRDEERGAWVFKGIGEGSSAGITVEKAKALAQSGSDAASILTDLLAD